VAPVLFEKKPVEHAAHVLGSDEFENVPALHAEHNVKPTRSVI